MFSSLAESNKQFKHAYEILTVEVQKEHENLAGLATEVDEIEK